MDSGKNLNRVKANVIASVLQIVVSMIVMLIVYGVVLSDLGSEMLGIWSIVLASSSISKISEFGLSASVIKYVAKYKSQNDNEAIIEIISTALLSVGFVVGIVSFLLFPIIQLILSSIFNPEQFELVRTILPYALMSMWCLSVAGILLGGIAGFQRYDLQSILLVISYLLYLILVFFTVDDYGLVGLAYAQVAQCLFLVVSSLIIIFILTGKDKAVVFKWRKSRFREMLKYGIYFQIITFAVVLFDPITKYMLGRFAGLPEAGYYEMASRIMNGFKSLFVSANKVMIPYHAELAEKDSGSQLKNAYIENLNITIYLSVPFFAMLMVLTPAISWCWIGGYQQDFIVYALLYAIANLVNVIAAPAYFSYFGIGRLQWITAAHVYIVIQNIALGFLLGYYWSGNGVVIGMTISVIVGSLFIVYMYHREYSIPNKLVLNKEQITLLGVVSVAIVAALVIPYSSMLPDKEIVNAVISLITFAMLTAIPMWKHPVKAKIISGIYNRD